MLADCHTKVIYFLSYRLTMDWESARNYCIERNWHWSLNVIDQAQREMEGMEEKIKKMESQPQAQRL